MCACSSQAGTAAWEYGLCYPGWHRPHANVFQCLEKRFHEAGSVTSVAHVNAGRPWTVRTPTNDGTIIAAVEWEPWRSSWNITWELEVSQQRVLRVLHDDQLHPYHYLWSAHLFPDDCPLQMKFCKWLRHQHTADELFLHTILWTGEACFMHEGMFNIHNSHLWA
jgi:hypothetical protein